MMMSAMQVYLISAWVCMFVALTSGYIETEPMYDHLHHCLEMETRNTSVADEPAAGLIHSCIQSFLSFTFNERMHHNVSADGLAWIRSLVKKYITKRHKRQAVPSLRVRREIRRLSDEERGRLFAAFNVLKNNGRFDILSSFHQGFALRSAHNGPNFLSWHRIYILAVEEALREVDATVTLPYWDSSIDFDMYDPIQSVVWSSHFFGNGNGIVNSGPFRLWRTLDGALLTRNIGSFGTSLMQKGLINNIISRRNNIYYHWQIIVWFGERPWLRRNILERQHDGVHTWVGGLMRGLATSAQDPVFFFHHCFIDYLWELFRRKQRDAGIDPTTDYLPDRFLRDRPAHFASRVMDGFPDYRNIDGYDDRYTREIYTYERSPECPVCGSPYMYCDSARGVCISQDRAFIGESVQNPMAAAASMDASRGAMAQGPLPLGETFQSSFVDPRAQGTPMNTRPRSDGPAGSAIGAFMDSGSGTGSNLASDLLRTSERVGAFNRQARARQFGTRRGFQFSGFNHPAYLFSNTGSTRNEFGLSRGMPQFPIRPNSLTNIVAAQNPYIPQIPHHPPQPQFSSRINAGIQNTFAMDGVADVNRWAFMPVRIVHRRPVGASFRSQVIRNGQVVPGTDFYNPSIYRPFNPYIQSGRPATYPKCSNYGSGASKVFIETNGVNYAGSYKDYALIDQRQPVMESFTYVGFRNPTLGMSRAYVHAYDSSGRVCQPRCLVRNSIPPRYIPCSGAIRATTGLPTMYGNTYGDAVLGRWDFKRDQCPSSYNGEVFMTFYCEYNDSWPWKDCPYTKKGKK